VTYADSTDTARPHAIPGTMRAVRFHAHGGPEVLSLDEVPVPAPGPGEVLMRVTTAGVNGWDIRARAGAAPQIPGRPPTPLPFQPGREAAGEIAAVGSGVSGREVGERVVLLSNPSCGRCSYCVKRGTHLCVARELPGHTAPGAYAEYIVVAADAILPTPASLSDREAAPILWAYGTALHMLDVAEFRAGDSVVVTAAAGAMGIACVQLAKCAGASVVIGLTRSPAKYDDLRAAGADEVFDHRDPDTPDRIRGVVRALGVDVVLDNHGGQEIVDFGMGVLDLGGRYVIIASEATGFGNTLGVDPLRMIGKHISLRACRASTRWEQEEVLRMAARRQIAMPIAEVFPIDEVQAAHRHHERGAQVGKVLLAV
jgi:NADPH:quinone reductase-like Zn-dependent oxidoreductase